MAEISVYWENSVYLEENILFGTYCPTLRIGTSLYTMMFSNYIIIESGACTGLSSS